MIPLLESKEFPRRKNMGTQPSQLSTDAGCAKCTQHKGPCTKQLMSSEPMFLHQIQDLVLEGDAGTYPFCHLEKLTLSTG
jgi:hypothetical protein